MILLDTHLLLWAAFEPSRLSSKATKALQSREVPLMFSLAKLVGSGRKDVARPTRLFR